MNSQTITRLRPCASNSISYLRATSLNKRLPSHFPHSHRTFSSTSRRFNSDTQPKQTSPHIAPYKAFGRPFAKVFLGAVFTYQVIYWAWLKLEMDESKMQKNEMVADLEKKVQELTSKPPKEQ